MELDAADTDFLAAILDVIEAYGQVRSVIIPWSAWLTCVLQMIACCMLSMRPCVGPLMLCRLYCSTSRGRHAKLASDHLAS